MYIAFYSISSNYFGFGKTKEEAYKDLRVKWGNNNVDSISSFEDCSYFKVIEEE